MQRIKRNLKLFIQEETNFLQTTTIRTVAELNQKFKHVNDIYSFHNLIEEISNNITKKTYDNQKFCKFTRRLIQGICFAIQKYAYDFSRTSFLVQTLYLVNLNWKKVLIQQFQQIKQSKTQKKYEFLYTLQKNQFFFYVLKGSNFLLQKQIYRLIKNNSINIKSLFYLKKCSLKSLWTNCHKQMIKIASQTQNESYLKIQLLTQFLRHTLYQVNFCTTQQDFQIVYKRLFQLSRQAFRFIKKFYSLTIISSINNIKKIIIKGIQIYREISFEFPNKYRLLTNLLNSFQNKNIKSRKQVDFNSQTQPFKNPAGQVNNLNPKSYAIKLALRLLTSWKQVKLRKTKQSVQKQKQNMSIQMLPLFMKKKDQQSLKQKFLVSLEKEKFNLKNRAKRSNSAQTFKIDQLPTIHKVHVRKQIEQQIDREFGKLKYLKNCIQQKEKVQKIKKNNLNQEVRKPLKSRLKRSFSFKDIIKHSMRLSTKQNNEQKQVDIEEYKEKLNLCRKQVNTLNRVVLYQPQKHNLVLHGGTKKNISINNFTIKNRHLVLNQTKAKLHL